MNDLERERDEWKARAERAERIVEAVKAIHKPFDIYGECGHDHDGEVDGAVHVEDIGYTCKLEYRICHECCTCYDEQSETCEAEHIHTLDGPICSTVAALKDET